MARLALLSTFISAAICQCPISISTSLLAAQVYVILTKSWYFYMVDFGLLYESFEPGQ